MNGKRISTGPTPTAARVGHDWQDDARCRTTGDHPDLWHPSPSDRAAIYAARAICNACPVKDECLRAALADPELTGVWGATTDVERAGMRGLRVDDRCGTYAGYSAHKRRGERQCRPCMDAQNEYSRNRQTRKTSA